MIISQVTTQFLRLCLLTVGTMHAGCTFARINVARRCWTTQTPDYCLFSGRSVRANVNKERRLYTVWEGERNVANHQLLSVTKHARCCVQRGCLCSSGHHRHTLMAEEPGFNNQISTGVGGADSLLSLERALWHQNACGSVDNCKSTHVRWKIIQARTITRFHAHKADGRGNQDEL